jgi:hypothetical protein
VTELVEIFPREKQAVLNQIFSNRRVCRQPPRHTEKAPGMAHGYSFELVCFAGHGFP